MNRFRTLAGRAGRVVSVVALAALLGASRATPLRAQASWDAQLAISAFPSPYLSDWEANPSIGTLTITNPGADQNVILAYRVTNQRGQLLASGRSTPILIPRGPPTVITDIVNMSGSSQHDQALESQMRRTGRLPEGDNTTCVVVTDAGGFVLAEDCATFSIVYPDPPYLVGPLDEAAMASGYPIFQWTPLQVPTAFHLTYVLRVAEVLAGQTPLQALTANIPVFETTTGTTSLEYPLGGLPLVQGKSYAWRVQALDQNGYAASSNDGRSEVWTFAVEPAGVVPPEGPQGPVSMRVAFFDAAGPLPEIWQTLDTATFGQFVNYLAGQARRGELEIPLPMPALEEQAGLGSWTGAGLGTGGAQGAAAGLRRSLGCADDPNSRPVIGGLRPMFSATGGSGGRAEHQFFLLEGEVSIDLLNPLLACLGVEGASLPPVADAAFQLAAWQGPGGGMPHVTLGIKLRAFPHSDRGLVFKHAVFVITLLGDFTISRAELPAAMQDFYGNYSFEVWGTGIIDLLSGLAGARKDRWKLWQAMPGVNFFGVIDLSLAHAALESLNLTPVVDSVILQGFVGFREKTYRQLSFGGQDQSGRAGRKTRDVWYMRGSIALASADLIPAITSRHLVVEYGRRDVSDPHAMPAFGDTTAMPSRYRLAVRIVLGGFDAWKPYLGVHPDSSLKFFLEVQGETTVQPTPTRRPRSNAIAGPDDGPAPTGGRPRSNDVTSRTEDPASRYAANATEMSLTFGTDATFQAGPLYFHDVKATWLMTSRVFRLSTDWGFEAPGVGAFERVGVLTIEPYLTPPPPAPGARICDECDQVRRQLREAREQQAAARQALQAMIDDQLADLRAGRSNPLRQQQIDVALSRARELDPPVEQLEQRMEALDAREAAANGQRRRLRFKVTIGLDQGATVAELLGRIPGFVQWLTGN